MVRTVQKAVVWFTRSGEHEIVMHEIFACNQQYPVDYWAARIGQRIPGFSWLFDTIEVIKVEYFVGIAEGGGGDHG